MTLPNQSNPKEQSRFNPSRKPRLQHRGFQGHVPHSVSRTRKLEIAPNAIPAADEGPRLSTATWREILDMLTSPAARAAAKEEINRRLPPNEANRHFFWLTCGWLLAIHQLVTGAYHSLIEMGRRHLRRSRRPIQVERWGTISAESQWDDLIHHTLFGNETVMGALEKVLPLSIEEVFDNALKNRYSGILTRLDERLIDEWRKSRHELPVEEIAAVFVEGEDGQDVYSSWLENIPDSRSGHAGVGQSSVGAEQVCEENFALVEWTRKHDSVIESEAGKIAQKTWTTIVKALASGTIDTRGLTSAQTKKELVSVIAKNEGVSPRTASHRIRLVRRSTTLKEHLRDEIRRGERYQAPPARLVKVGESRQRKKVGCEHFNVPDRRRIEGGHRTEIPFAND